MEICRHLAGYSYGRADLVRRAMAKKKHDVMEKERSVFVHGDDTCCGAVKNGVPEAVAHGIFDKMTAFASYAFNKSHAAAYARVAYETAYLKCRHYKEYMAALMTSVLSSTDKLLLYIADCEAHGVRVLPPDINRSEAGFTAESEGIRFGLLAIRGLGSNVIDALIRERSSSGSYRDLMDFCRRNVGAELGKRSVEGLIRAGAFDGLGWTRRQMLENYEQIMNAMLNESRRVISGQLSLFGGDNAEDASVELHIPHVPEYPEGVLLKMEKEITGLYLSGHPLGRWNAHCRLLRMQETGDLPRCKDGQTVRLLCMPEEIRLHNTKSGEQMCFFRAVDAAGDCDCVVFPKLFGAVKSLLQPDTVICMEGTVTRRDGRLSLRCDALLGEAQWAQSLGAYRLCCKIDDANGEQLRRLMETARRFRGDTPLCIWLNTSRRYLIPKQQVRVHIDNGLLKALEAIGLTVQNCALIK